MTSTTLCSIVHSASIVQEGGKRLRLWTYEEDKVLLRVVGDATPTEKNYINWVRVCKVLSWRTPQQCRGRFRRIRNAEFEIKEATGVNRSKPLNHCKRCGAIRTGHTCPYLNKAPKAKTPQTVLHRKKAVKEKAVAVAEEEEEPPKRPAFPALDDYIAWKDALPTDIIKDVEWVFGAVLK